MITLFAIRSCLLCCLLLLGMAAHASTAPALVLESVGTRLEIAPWLDKLPTKLATLSSSQLLASPDDLPWQALEQSVLAQGHLRDGLWLRLKIRNDGLAQRRIIEFSRANINHIEIVTQQRNGSWLTRHAGASEWLPRGDISGPGFSFSLTIPEGRSTTYLHLRSAYPLATPIHLSSENELVRAFQNSSGFFGAMLGLLGGITIGMAALRSARLSIATRWIFAVLVNVVILQALIERDILGYWWLDIPSSQYSFIQLSGCMLSIMHLLLCRQFLVQQQALSMRSRQLLQVSILANLIWMLLSVAWLPNQWSPIADGLHWLGYVAILAMLWQPARQGLRHARPYRAIIMTGLATQLWSDASLHGHLPFLAEPYQLMMLWHLITVPALLYLLEQPAAEHKPATRPVNSISKALPRASATTSPSLPVITRVLIVEDNPWVQQVLAGLLLKLNCQTCLAGDGREALKRLESEAFDLVLMDCDLPELDGFSATQQWRAKPSHNAHGSDSRIPIIAITAHISASHRLQAEEAGMDDFLQKPIDMRALHEVLTRWLPQYSAKA